MKEHLGAHYDRTSLFQQEQFDTLVRLIRKTVPDIANIKSLLDIGCGVGSRTMQCFDIFPNLQHITAFDPDWEMIETAEKKYGDPRVTYRKMAAADLPQLAAENKMYDAVISNWSLHWVEDKPKMLKDLLQVTKPGGYLLFSTSQALPGILTMIDDYVRMEFRVAKDHNVFFHERSDAWRQLLTQGGWKITDLTEDCISRDVESASKYIEHWFTSSATKAMYGKHLAELSSLTRSDIVFMIERSFPSTTPGMELSFTEDVMFTIAQKS